MSTSSGSGGHGVNGVLTIELDEIEGRYTRAGVMEIALDRWRDFVGDEDAVLPWNTSLSVTTRVDKDGDLYSGATVTVKWDRL